MKRSLPTRAFGPERASLALITLPLTTLVGAAVLFAGCNSGGRDNNSALPAPTPQTTEVPVAVTPAASPVVTGQPGVLGTIYLPGADGKLTKLTVPPAVLSKETRGTPSALPALGTIIVSAPKFFPPGTQVKTIRATPKLVTVDLSSAFDNQDFWSTSGESVTLVAVYALVNSAATIPDAHGDPGPRPVQLTCAGKPLSSLGEFDAGDPMTFDKSLVSAP